MHPEASTQFDISVLDVAGEGTVRPFVQTPAMEGQARFSPDQRWIAYQSDESGHMEIYVRHFPDGGQRTVISSGGGTQPQWDRRGRELFYLAADGSITGVSVRADGDRLVVGTPQPLFQVRVQPAGGMFGGIYAPADDGSRFLVIDVVGEQAGPRLNVVLNWPATLKN